MGVRDDIVTHTVVREGDVEAVMIDRIVLRQMQRERAVAIAQDKARRLMRKPRGPS